MLGTSCSGMACLCITLCNTLHASTMQQTSAGWNKACHQSCQGSTTDWLAYCPLNNWPSVGIEVQNGTKCGNGNLHSRSFWGLDSLVSSHIFSVEPVQPHHMGTLYAWLAYGLSHPIQLAWHHARMTDSPDRSGSSLQNAPVVKQPSVVSTCKGTGNVWFLTMSLTKAGPNSEQSSKGIVVRNLKLLISWLSSWAKKKKKHGF